MVGDSRTDIDTAKAAGIPVVAVDFGYTDRHVREFEPSVVISHYDELTRRAGRKADRGGDPGRLKMILIGQYNSPFVRRVGIALTLYGMAFEHRPWSVFGDTEKIRPYNPLVARADLGAGRRRGADREPQHPRLSRQPRRRRAALFPATEPARHQALRIAALATGIGEKAVSLFYEKRLHREISDVWVDRCRSQVLATLAVLEADRAAQGERLLVRRPHRPCRYRGRRRAALHRRSASGAGLDGGLPRARRPCRAARGAAGVPGDLASPSSRLRETLSSPDAAPARCRSCAPTVRSATLPTSSPQSSGRANKPPSRTSENVQRTTPSRSSRNWPTSWPTPVAIIC